MTRTAPILLLPGALLAAALLFSCAAPAAADPNYNNQTVDLNELAVLLSRVEDRHAGDPVRRTDWLLQARKLHDACRARKVAHPGLEPATKRFAEAEKKLRDELWELVNTNLSETDHMKSLKFLKQLLRIAPEDPNYKKWEATLTRKDLLEHQARVYTGGGEEATASLSTLRGNQIREWLDLAYEDFQYRQFEDARKKYLHVQKGDPGNVEAQKRLEEIDRLRPLANDVESLSAVVEDFRRSFSLRGYAAAALLEHRAKLDRIDAADPDFALRRLLFHPKEPLTVAKHPQKKASFARRLERLKDDYLRHLSHASIVRIALEDAPRADRLLEELIREERDSLYTLEIRILVDDARGRYVSALSQLRDYMKKKGFAGNVFSLYGRLLFHLGDPEYAFVFRNHARIYGKLYWPMLLLLASLCGTLAWTGQRTFRLWDEVTDGLLLRILTFSNKTPMEFFDGGNACMAARKFEKAVKLFTKALEVDKAFAEALYARGLARVELNEFEEARKDLEAHVRLRPGNGRSLYHLAVCYDRIGRRAEAIVTIEQAIGLGLQSREFNLDEAERNKALYRRVMNEYLKTAETLLSVKARPAAKETDEPAA